MRHYKIIARVLFILSTITFAFALPIAIQETPQLSSEMVPDVAITMSAKRGHGEAETLSGQPESSGSAQSESYHGPMSGHAPPHGPTLSTEPDHGSMYSSQMGTSEIQEVKPELMKSPSFHYLVPPVSAASPELMKSPSFHYLAAPDTAASPVPFASKPFSSGSSGYLPSSEASPSVSVSSTPKERPKWKSFLRKVFSKIKFWRRISGPAAQAPTGVL